MKRLFMFITGFLTTSGQASDHLFYPDLRMMGMGGFQVTQSQYVNPALLPVLEERTIHLGCYDSYGLRELMTMGAACSYPNPWLSAGLDVASFGYDAYRESQARLSLAKALGKGWSLGVAFRDNPCVPPFPRCVCGVAAGGLSVDRVVDTTMALCSIGQNRS